MRPPPDNLVALGERWRTVLARGVRSLESGDHEAAQTHFAEAFRLAPERAETCAALGREHLRRGHLDQAEPLLRRAHAQAPELLSAAAALARLVGLGRGKLGEAQGILEQSLLQNPEEPAL